MPGTQLAVLPAETCLPLPCAPWGVLLSSGATAHPLRPRCTVFSVSSRVTSWTSRPLCQAPTAHIGKSQVPAQLRERKPFPCSHWECRRLLGHMLDSCLTVLQSPRPARAHDVPLPRSPKLARLTKVPLTAVHCGSLRTGPSPCPSQSSWQSRCPNLHLRKGTVRLEGKMPLAHSHVTRTSWAGIQTQAGRAKAHVPLAAPPRLWLLLTGSV